MMMMMTLELITQFCLSQVNAHIHIDSRSQTMQGVSFPLTDEACDAVSSFLQGAINYVQLVRLFFSKLFFLIPNVYT